MPLCLRGDYHPRLPGLVRVRYASAKKYLDSLCEGEHPRLRRKTIGTTFQYVPVKDENPDSRLSE